MKLIRWPHVLAAAVFGGAGAYLLASRRSELGAWCGRGAIATDAAIAGTIARAKAAGVQRLDLFVNDASADLTQGPIAFHLYDRARVVAACAAFKAAGLRVSLTSWATPRPDWIAGMVEVGKLASEVGADEITLDLEEPWTVIASRDDAAIGEVTRQLFAGLRSAFGGRIGVTCIVYANLRVLGPAIKLADLVLPQAYAVAGNTAGKPIGWLERVAVERYTPIGKPIVLGVAAYGVPGYGLPSVASMTAASLSAARGLGVRRVRLWWLPTMGADVAAVTRGWGVA